VNLALPAFVLLLGILPGVSCFYGYFAGRFDRRVAGVSGVEELALYLALAIPIDAAALAICRRFGVDFDFDVAARLVAGSLSDASISTIADTFRVSPALNAFTYVSVLASSYLLGSFGRRTVWALRLITSFRYFG
jgi:hypothetical protein